jgi:competence protein ComEC
VTLALRPEALADDCAHAVLLVTARQAPSTCAAPVITLERLRRQGTLAVRLSRDGFVVDAIKPKGFERPWSPAADGDAEPGLVRAPAAPRAVDATPAEADQQSED